MIFCENLPAEPINPNHYRKNGVQCIESIKTELSSDEFRGYLKGNIRKYLWRYKEKNGIEDLNKAQKYLSWLIEFEENEEK